ncbi:hypothetical protein EDD65_101178 [Keratinibaculum paraultunense]|uniref:Uncharacterized protein n=1 Tax=Keratinibaculum paraultunense TaxID=1278232 RepID=A0A4R3L0G6_9FIRM|nr:hypothetical protein [Keratinibaculum paraultunense]NLV77526.1 hypothetical protein [Tissierellia bacterium]QQY80001.1 hypothetical protein JL105_01320 [Keratinibaculum paraultunense]TCS91675.1 hypothetical protein EDD65_101178 [Keratinibaculum paraultunense]
MSFWEKFKEDFNKQVENEMEKSEQRKKQKKIEKQEYKNRIKEMKKENKYKKKQMDIEGIAYCPKCKSTSIQYIERRKRLSLGRAVVGTALFSPLGGAVGAVTSKKYKGFIKCLNCGHKWKM